MKPAKKNIIVFYNARQGLPLRAANLAHLLCWGRYSKHRVVYVNVAYPVPWWLLSLLQIDVVIFDTIFLSMHWSPAYFKERSAQVLRIRDLAPVKVAVVQDEFINTDYVVEFLNAVQITDVLTITTAADRQAVYGGLDWHRVRFRSVLTGYVDETRVQDIKKQPVRLRSIDIGYRAWANPFWLGEHGRKKVLVGEIIREAAVSRGFAVDINNPASKDFLIGDDWFDFLLQCRCVLGVEGGASVLDRDGSIKDKVERYLLTHPNASFETVREECFAEAEGSLKELAALSPRHFEAAMTRTCQVLVEGAYNGVLTPWRHYIAVKPDFSNLEEVLDVIADDDRVKKIADQAYTDLIASGRWSYRAFVAEIEDNVVDVERGAGISSKPSSLKSAVLAMCLRIFDLACWYIAHLESSRFGKFAVTLKATSIRLSLQILRPPYRALRSIYRGFLRIVRTPESRE